jgi:hypothetical protein
MNKNEEIEFVEQCIQTIDEVAEMIENGLETEVQGSEEYMRGRKDGYIQALYSIKKAFIHLKKSNLCN